MFHIVLADNLMQKKLPFLSELEGYSKQFYAVIMAMHSKLNRGSERVNMSEASPTMKRLLSIFVFM